MDKTALKEANKGAKKVVYWVVVSGAATTVLTGLLALLSQLENGDVGWKRFASMAGILVVNGVLNALLYWVAKYREVA